MLSQATIQTGIEVTPHRLGQSAVFRAAALARNFGGPAQSHRRSDQAPVAPCPNSRPGSQFRPSRVGCPQAGKPVGESWIPRSPHPTTRPVSGGNLSTIGRHKMDITKLNKPLQWLSLALAFVSAILPVFSLGIVAYNELTGVDAPFGHIGLFVVSVLAGASIFL